MKIWEIVRVIEESPVRVESSDLDLDVVFVTPAGYRFQVFFDCDEPDYLNWFEEACGERIDFWREGSEGRALDAVRFLASNLIAMPHVGERLKAALVRFKAQAEPHGD